MEAFLPIWAIAVLALLLGSILGFVAGRYFTRHQSPDPHQAQNEARAQHERYRNEVLNQLHAHTAALARLTSACGTAQEQWGQLLQQLVDEDTQRQQMLIALHGEGKPTLCERLGNRKPAYDQPKDYAPKPSPGI